MRWPAKRSFSGPARWDPFEEIKRTQERLNQLFEDFMPMEEWGGGKVYTPAIDIKEEDDKLLVTTDLPGINKEDVEINLKEDMLEISAISARKRIPKIRVTADARSTYTHCRSFPHRILVRDYK